MYEDDYENYNTNYNFSPKKKRHPLQERVNDGYQDYETKFGEMSIEDAYEKDVRPSKYNGLRIPKEDSLRGTRDYFADSRYMNDYRRESPFCYSNNKEYMTKFSDYVNSKHKNRDMQKYSTRDHGHFEDVKPNSNRKPRIYDEMNYKEDRNRNMPDDSYSDESTDMHNKVKNQRQNHDKKFFDTFYSKNSRKSTGKKQNIERDDCLNKEMTPKEASQLFDKLQREVDMLKEKQRDNIHSKENMSKIVERAVEKAREEIENEKNKEIEMLIERHKNEMRRRDMMFREAKKENEVHLEKYKTACVKRIKYERNESNKKLDAFKSFYEDKLAKYKNAYLKLKEKYKTEVFKKYTDL